MGNRRSSQIIAKKHISAESSGGVHTLTERKGLGKVDSPRSAQQGRIFAAAPLAGFSSQPPEAFSTRVAVSHWTNAKDALRSPCGTVYGFWWSPTTPGTRSLLPRIGAASLSKYSLPATGGPAVRHYWSGQVLAATVGRPSAITLPVT